MKSIILIALFSCFTLLFSSPVSAVKSGYRMNELQVNDWFFWEGQWQQSKRFPGKSFCLYKINVRPGETYCLAMKYQSSENVDFTLGYSDVPPFESLLSTNNRSNLLHTGAMKRTERYVHNRIIKIDESSKGRSLYVYVGLNEGVEESFHFGIRMTYLAFAGLSRKNQSSFINDGKIVIEDHQALQEELLCRVKGSPPEQNLFSRIPVIHPQNGFFFVKNISQIIIPREGLLTRAGSVKKLPDYEREKIYENQKVFFPDKNYSLSLRVYLKSEMPLTVWARTFSDGNYFWGSRELDIFLNNKPEGSLSEKETSTSTWSWQKVGRYNFAAGANVLKFRKKDSTGAIAVMERVIITRDPDFHPADYDRVHRIQVVGDPAEIKPIVKLKNRSPKYENLAGKWTYSMRNKKSNWKGHVMIKQSGREIEILGFSKRHRDQKGLSWVEKGQLDGRLLLSKFKNRYTAGRVTYNLSKDRKILYGVWNRPGEERPQGVVQLVRVAAEK